MIKLLVSLLAPSQKQFQSYVAHTLTAAGAALIVGHPDLGAWFSPNIVGALAAFLGVFYSHALHRDGGDNSGPGNVVPLFAGLLAVVAIGAGCQSTQVTTHESGYGAKGHITVPVPFSGGVSLIDSTLIVGWFKSTQSIQPTSTNRLFAPSVAIADVSSGAETAGGGVGSNSLASVHGGTRDKYLFISGDTTAKDSTNGTALDGYNGYVPTNNPAK